MVTPRNFDSEVVLREDLFNCIEGCQRASSKLLVKKAILHLLALQASLGRRLHSATFIMASCMAVSATLLRMAAEECEWTLEEVC